MTRKTKRMRIPALILLSLYICGAVEARIVNTQDKLFSISRDGLYVDTDLSFTRTTGTAEVLQFSGGLGTQWLREPHLLYFSASGTLAMKDDERFINSYFGHLRYRIRIWKMTMAEAFVQGEYNEFRRILTRTPCGIGPRIEHAFGENSLFQLAFGTSYMFEFVYLSKGTDEHDVPYTDSLATEHNHRWNNYLAFKVNLDFMSIGATIYAQPLLEDFSDITLLLESDVTFKVTDSFRIGLSYTLFHDTRPPEGVVRQDTALNAVLKLSFGPLVSGEKPTPTDGTVTGGGE